MNNKEDTKKSMEGWKEAIAVFNHFRAVIYIFDGLGGMACILFSIGVMHPGLNFNIEQKE